MKKKLLILLLLFSISILFSQEKNRVLISGVVIVENNDVEGLTVYNLSSNKGTITDEKGDFQIEVALNDKIQISALQFVPLTIKINQTAIDSKSLKVYLSEKMNSLDEVLLLPHNLTGDLTTDVVNAEVIKPIPFSFGSFDDYEFSADAQSSVENIALNDGKLNNGLNVTGLIGLLVKTILKKRNENKSKYVEPILISPVLIAKKFPQSYFIRYFDIPEEEVSTFLLFLERNADNQELINPENELELIEFLNVQSKLFLSQKNEKK